jgi:hypothetical protein
MPRDCSAPIVRFRTPPELDLLSGSPPPISVSEIGRQSPDDRLFAERADPAGMIGGDHGR